MEGLEERLFSSQPGDRLLNLGKCIDSLIKHPIAAIDSVGGQYWRSVFTQELPEKELTKMDVRSLKRCQPQNLAFLIFLCIEQLWVYVKLVTHIMDATHHHPSVMYEELTKMHRYHQTVCTSLAILQRTLGVVGEKHSEIDFMDAIFFKNGSICGEQPFRQLGGSELRSTLALVLVESLACLLHSPGFTVDIPRHTDGYIKGGSFTPRGAGLSSHAEREFVWAPLDDLQQHRYLRHRCLVLGAVVATMGSGTRLTSPWAFAPFHRLWTERAVKLPHRTTFFASLLNTVCSACPPSAQPSTVASFVSSSVSRLSSLLTPTPSPSPQKQPTSPEKQLLEQSLNVLLLFLQCTRFKDSGLGGQVLNVEQVVEKGDFFWSTAEMIGKGEAADTLYVAHGIVAHLRSCIKTGGVLQTTLSSLDALINGGDEEPVEREVHPFAHRYAVFLLQLLTASAPLRAALCAAPCVLSTVETLLRLLHAAVEDMQMGKATRGHCVVLLCVLQRLTADPALAHGVDKPWQHTGLLKQAVSRPSMLTARGGKPPTIDVLWTGCSEAILAAIGKLDACGTPPPHRTVLNLVCESAMHTLLNLSPYLQYTAVVVTDYLMFLLEILATRLGVVGDQEGGSGTATCCYIFCLLFEVLYFLLAFNARNNSSLLCCMLRRRELLRTVENYVGAEEQDAGEREGEGADWAPPPSIAESPRTRWYPKDGWEKKVLITPVAGFVRAAGREYAAAFPTEPKDDRTVVRWLDDTYLPSPLADAALSRLRSHPLSPDAFHPTLPTTVPFYSLLHTHTWELLSAPVHSDNLFPADV